MATSSSAVVGVENDLNGPFLQPCSRSISRRRRRLCDTASFHHQIVRRWVPAFAIRLTSAKRS